MFPTTTCPACGKDPYQYVNDGTPTPRPVAVVCCFEGALAVYNGLNAEEEEYRVKALPPPDTLD